MSDVENSPAPETPADPDPEANTIESLPEWAQKEIKRLRRESANYRTNANDHESQLTSLRDEWARKEAEFTQQISTSAMELARYRAAVSSGIPADRIDDFASRLRGSTPEELAADATSLADLFNVTPTPAPTRGVDPSQGRGNGQQTPNTPASAFAEMVRGSLGG